MNVPSYLLFCLDFGIVEGDGIRTLRQYSPLQLAEPILVIFSLGKTQPSIVSQPGIITMNPGRACTEHWHSPLLGLQIHTEHLLL